MKLSSLKTPLTAVAVAAVVLTLAACGKKDGGVAQVIKIGHVGPTSGAIAHLGKDNENGAKMAIEELNAAGIKIGDKVTVKFKAGKELAASVDNKTLKGSLKKDEKKPAKETKKK